MWSGVFVALLVISAVITTQTDYVGRSGNRTGPAIGGMAMVGYLFVLYVYLGALARLKQAREVLEAYPWQLLPQARKVSGVREAAGVPVHLALPEGYTAPSGVGGDLSAESGGVRWSPTMSARDPRRWNRWDERLEHGAWFAGDPCRWGILAVPGGTGLMTVQLSTANLSAERTSAKRDRESVLAAAPRS